MERWLSLIRCPPVSPRERRDYPFSRFLKERFGTKVYRVTIDAGFTCPNVDGTVAVGGCVYCDNRSFSPNRRLPRTTDSRSSRSAASPLLQERYRADRFLAYFQAATNTYAPWRSCTACTTKPWTIRRSSAWRSARGPTVSPSRSCDLLQSYARERYVCLELGLQSMHDRSLDWMNRGHHFDAFRGCGPPLPGTRARPVRPRHPGAARTRRVKTCWLRRDALAALPIEGVKIHNLHVVHDTPLEKMYQAGQVRMLEREEYVHLVCDFLERLPPRMVIHRLSGDAPPDYLVAPLWCLDKPRLLHAIHVELELRESWQGRMVAGW